MKTSILILLLGISMGSMAQQIPYNFDKRPMPVGEDWRKILPKKVGQFVLVNLKLDNYKNCQFSCDYVYGSKKIQIWGYWGVCSDYGPVVASGCPELIGDTYTLVNCSDRAAFDYRRKNYSFHVSTKTRSELDEFMALFPY